MAKKSILKYILLGLIRRKPRSGYDLDQAFKKEVGEFWQARHSQIYPELGKMENQNLIRFETELTGKLEKKVYYLTESGEKMLRQWVHQPSDDLPVNRDEFILRLFFLSGLEDPGLSRILKEQFQLHHERLEYLKGRMAEHFPTRARIDVDFGHYLVLDRAISRESEYVAWLEKTLKRVGRKRAVKTEDLPAL